MPPMPPPGIAGPAPSLFGLSAIMASVAINSPAIDAAFCRAASALNFLSLLRFVPGTPCEVQRQAVACPRAARKSGTYRSLRSLQVAAQVPSAGTFTLQRVELSSARVPSSTRFSFCARSVRRVFPLIERLKAMQIPSILQGNSPTRLLQGIAIGAVASMVIGFSWGGWMTGGSAIKQLADEQASCAVSGCPHADLRGGNSCRTTTRKRTSQSCKRSLRPGNKVITCRRAAGQRGRGLRPPTTSWPGCVQSSWTTSIAAQ